MTARPRILSTIAALLAIIGIAITAIAGAQTEHGLFKPNEPQIVSLGRQIYAEQCASCHGVDLEGEEDWKTPKAGGQMPAPPHDETGHTWHHPDQQLFDITKYGIAELMNLKDYKTDMPVYRDILTDDEIIAVLSFIKAQWPAEIRERHDELNRRTFVGE